MKLTTEALSEALELSGLPESKTETRTPGFLVYSSGHDFVACWVYSGGTQEWRDWTRKILKALAPFGAEPHGEFAVVIRVKKD